MMNFLQEKSFNIPCTMGKGFSLPSMPLTALLECEKVGEHTVVRRGYAEAPLRLLTPRNLGKAAWVYTSNYGGGLVGGDNLHLQVQIGKHAEALVLTQSTTKVYRSAQQSSQSLTAAVADDASLMLIPDPVSCFRGANYFQQQQIFLAPHASLLLVDSFLCGRRAFGEFWSFARYHSQLQVWRNHRLLFYDALLLEAKNELLAARLGPFAAYGLILLLGPQFATQGKNIIASYTTIPPHLNEGLMVSPSYLSREGVVVRIAASSPEQLGSCLKMLLSFLPERLGDNPFQRKW